VKTISELAQCACDGVEDDALRASWKFRKSRYEFQRAMFRLSVAEGESLAEIARAIPITHSARSRAAMTTDTRSTIQRLGP
jgi:hypothetical protein